MQVFDKVLRILGLGVTDEKAWDPSTWRLGNGASQSGYNVTPYSALNYSAVYNAVSLISGTIGSLPLHLMQRKGETKRIAENKSAYRVMHDQWNPYMSAMAGRETLMSHVLLWGNGYAEIVRNGVGDIVQLWPIPPDRVKVERHNGEILYNIQVDGQHVYLAREKVLHIPNFSPDGYMGYSVITLASGSIGLSMAMQEYGEHYFGQGTHPGIVVSHPNKLSDDSYKHLKQALTEAYSGLGNAHRLMLLEEGLKPEKISIPPNDSQFLESRQFQIPEIARWFNLPPHKLKDLTKSSFSNIEQEQISFVTDTILPWLIRLEQNFNNQLLTQFDRELSGRGRLYFKHTVEGLLRGDAASRGEFYTKMFNIGAMSINEIRGKEDLDPIEGGDNHLVPLNMTTLENAGKPVEVPEPPEKGEDEEEGGGENEEMVRDSK